MTLAVATVQVTDWIAARLAAQPGSADVAVYVASATDETPRPVAGAAGPYVTLRHLGSVDHRYVGGRRAATTVTYEVTAWDEGTGADRLAPIVTAIDAALDRQRGPGITGCTRVAPVERQIVEDDLLFTQLGGEYQIRASA